MKSGGSLTRAVLCTVLLAVAPVLAGHAEPVSQGPAETRAIGNDPILDPFLAGALGIIPFSSGLYVSDRPARGLLFTAVDILMVLGVYTSRYTAAGDPDNARNYFILMAANNVVDALVSVRYANMPRRTAMILPTPDGGLQASLYWRF